MEHLYALVRIDQLRHRTDIEFDASEAARLSGEGLDLSVYRVGEVMSRLQPYLN